ncbi:MAG: peptide chain release factor 1 [Candidatus Hydrogenedentota bacterium]
MHQQIEKIKKDLVKIEERLSYNNSAGTREFTEISKEYSRIRELANIGDELIKTEKEIKNLEELLKEDIEEELKNEAQNDLVKAKEKRIKTEQDFYQRLIETDHRDEKNIIMEIRAGTGGDEATLFVADLYRMYTKFADNKGWKYEVMSINQTGIGGFKEIIFQITGKRVFSYLKFERGVHRVQRVPVTEASGRIHTSAVSVAVLPQADDIEIEIDENDLRIDVFRASGHGGQHVNKTESAVRITHIPTGFTVTCQDEKSQHKNKAKAMKILKSRLLEYISEKEDEKRAKDRKEQVGTGDRSEKIRTYNFRDNRITDHRINLNLYNLNSILDGNLDELIDALIKNELAEKIKRISG